MKPLYLSFPKDTDPERARELFLHRFGTKPQLVFVEAGLLKVGPAPERVTQPKENRQ